MSKEHAMRHRLAQWYRLWSQGARMLVGMPDYEVYVSHMQTVHPDKTPMTYEEFFKERLEARYGGGKGRPIRCC